MVAPAVWYAVHVLAASLGALDSAVSIINQLTGEVSESVTLIDQSVTNVNEIVAADGPAIYHVLTGIAGLAGSLPATGFTLDMGSDGTDAQLAPPGANFSGYGRLVDWLRLFAHQHQPPGLGHVISTNAWPRTGQQVIGGAWGLALRIHGLGPQHGGSAGEVPIYSQLGRLTFGAGGYWRHADRIHYERQLFMPIPAGSNRVAWELQTGLTATAQWLVGSGTGWTGQ